MSIHVHFLISLDATLQDIMAKHRRQLDSEECIRLTVGCENLWEDCVVFFKQPKFNPKNSLRVKFSGEAGINPPNCVHQKGTLPLWNQPR